MPFEPIRTDEPIVGKVKRARDFDDLMLLGCSGFVATSLIGYALTVWPFFFFPTTYSLQTVGTSSALAFIPTLILGAFSIRKFGLPGACGFVAGAMATGVFLYLRIEQMFLAAAGRQSPEPDYPRLFAWAIPLAWILISVAVSLLLLPKGELGEDTPGKPPF